MTVNIQICMHVCVTLKKRDNVQFACVSEKMNDERSLYICDRMKQI